MLALEIWIRGDDQDAATSPSTSCRLIPCMRKSVHTTLRATSEQGETMGFTEAIRSGFDNYVTFGGRASRPAYWWWVLFGALVTLVTRVLDGLLGSNIVRTNQYGTEVGSALSPVSSAWRCCCPRSPSWCAGSTTPTARGGGTGLSSSPSSAGSCCSTSWSAPAPRATTGTVRRPRPDRERDTVPGRSTLATERREGQSAVKRRTPEA